LKNKVMKQKLKVIIVITMAIIISMIAVYTFTRVSIAIEHVQGSELIWKCFAFWIKSIVLTQAVLVVGGLFLFMLRKPKGTV